MKTIKTILGSIEANAEEFKRLCEAKVCAPDLLSDLGKALAQGSLLSADIDTVMSHLLDLKTRLEKSNEE
jgi:hypothetical protein